MLNTRYPEEEAAACLEQLASDRISTGYIAYPISRYAETSPSDHLSASIINTDYGSIWKLTPLNRSEEVQEEVVFSVQGIILHCELPPVLIPFGRSALPQHIRQRIILAGFDTPTFTTSLIGLNLVDDFLRLNIREDVSRPLPAFKAGQQTVEIANRYFTSARMAEPEERISISANVDPKGILESIRGETLFHTTENQVEYYQRTANINGGYRFATVSPARIHEGDIVEVQFTITLVETNSRNHTDIKQSFATKLILRSITLLDGAFSETYRKLASTQPRKPCLKRKVGHGDEECTEARERLKRMEIDNDKELHV